jgi:hypothetical protein
MSQRAAVVAIFASMTVVTVLLLAGQGPWAGRTIWHFDPGHGHGLHLGDLVPLGAWLVATLCCVGLWRRAD